jgi:hypothetical protein
MLTLIKRLHYQLSFRLHIASDSGRHGVVQSVKNLGPASLGAPSLTWVACQPVVILLSRIANALRSNGELTVGFGESGRVKDGADAVLAAALAQAETSRRSVSDNVAANGLGRV